MAILAATPEVALAQVEVADAASPKPADTSAVDEPTVADGLTPQVAGADQGGDAPVANGVLGLGDVQLVYAPPPSQYQPEGSGAPIQPVRVACIVGVDGHMQNCSVFADAPHDPNVADLAMGDVSQFVVALAARDGTPVTGQTLVVTCQFQPLDETSGRQDLAAN
jgi:hypothetical protein